MKCLKCSHLETQVVNSRQPMSQEYVIRRRRCTACQFRFTTYEQPAGEPLIGDRERANDAIVRNIRRILKHLTARPRRR